MPEFYHGSVTFYRTNDRVRNKKVVAQQRCKVVLLSFLLLMAFLGLLLLLQPYLMSWYGPDGTEDGVPLENLNQNRPIVDPVERNLCLLESDQGMCMAAMPREDYVQQSNVATYYEIGVQQTNFRFALVALLTFVTFTQCT